MNARREVTLEIQTITVYLAFGPEVFEEIDHFR